MKAPLGKYLKEILANKEAKGKFLSIIIDEERKELSEEERTVEVKVEGQKKHVYIIERLSMLEDAR